MRLPSVPGPRDVVDAVSRTGDAVDSLLAAVPRVVGLLGEAEELVGDARKLVRRIERTRADAQDVVRRTAATVEAADLVVARVVATVAAAEVVLARTTAAVDGAEVVLARAGTAVDEVGPVVARVTDLTDRLYPSLVALQPTLERLAETTDPHEVDALITLIDTTPALVERMQNDVLPVLTTLGSVAPDIHDLLDVSRELNLMLAKLPGMGRIKRRVDEQQDEDEDAS